MTSILPRGTMVRLHSDPSQDPKDRYGRLLRYIRKRDGDAGRRPLWQGHARVYVYNDNPFRRVNSYRAANHEAKKRHRGPWAEC